MRTDTSTTNMHVNKFQNQCTTRENYEREKWAIKFFLCVCVNLDNVRTLRHDNTTLNGSTQRAQTHQSHERTRSITHPHVKKCKTSNFQKSELCNSIWSTFFGPSRQRPATSRRRRGGTRAANKLATAGLGQGPTRTRACRQTTGIGDDDIELWH